ncbi:hypothetical protein A0U87_03870 [Sphingobium sp. MP9-4]|uniref:DNA -binding domain-containing protein n=1 Tax=Sphingobium sp. MP9-4 TaxID=1761936 RepID=UPI0010CA7362|nr:DUF2285 domain-containing protein [Sphingobium sp. MP9-4]TKV41671.1 hypothetical protein A0U87_03870 [Sphingobium sp. MP9-4]
MQVVPVWSAVLDPCVLRARIATGQANASCRFDAPARRARRISGTEGEHIAFDCLGEVARIDFVGERLPDEPVLLSFEIIADERLGSQLAALQRIYFHTGAGEQANRLRRQHLSLLAADARAAGASLRDVAELVLGPGNWPGDGDHRKSLVRRLVAAGALLCEKGPAAILQSWPDGNG